MGHLKEEKDAATMAAATMAEAVSMTGPQTLRSRNPEYRARVRELAGALGVTMILEQLDYITELEVEIHRTDRRVSARIEDLEKKLSLATQTRLNLGATVYDARIEAIADAVIAKLDDANLYERASRFSEKERIIAAIRTALT